MTPTEKGKRADALNQGPDTRRVLCEMVANREADMEELRNLVRDALACVRESSRGVHDAPKDVPRPEKQGEEAGGGRVSYDYERYDGKRIVVDGEVIGLLAMEFGHEVEEVWEEYHAELAMTEEQERQSEAYKESLRRTLSAQYEKVATLEADNAELRELVRDVWHLFTEHGAVNPCDLPVVDAVRDRMRELGVDE